MKQSQLFGHTLREPPKDEQSVNAQLLVQAGYVEKLTAGVYSYLPLGFRALKRIEQIIREEMQALGAQELLLPALHPKENWVTTGRWDGPDPLYKLQDAAGHEYALGSTHEEVVTPLARRSIASYRDLPVAVYQIQTKFRAELRAKSGLLRGREFMMKDLYSFHRDEADLDRYYATVQTAYEKIFQRCGIGEQTVRTYASGGSFSKYSHEFQTLTAAGEDRIYLCERCRIAINEEIIAEQNVCPKCAQPRDQLVKEKAIEVGNIFPLKTRYSAPFGLTFDDEAGVEQPVLMGCYGIGVGRLLGAIAEVHHDEQGLRWPAAIAPYAAHLVCLGDDTVVRAAADKLYLDLTTAGIDVLYDERSMSAGVKLHDADLIGLPVRIVVSAKTVARGSYEWKARTESAPRAVVDVVAELARNV